MASDGRNRVDDDIAYCLTHYLPDFTTCYRKSQHYADCPVDGCKGCVPREARFGFVCPVCFGRIEDALPSWRRMELALSGIDRAVTPETRTQGKPGSRLPLAPIPLAFEEIRSYLASYTGTAERWVADYKGAEDALRFARAVKNAEHAHPAYEEPHNLRRTRCPDCGQLTFTWHPPTMPGSPVKVRCHNDACGREVTRVESIDDIAYIEALPR